jgi:hypothetical protein
MEEEAKLEFTITVNWRREDGSIVTTQLGTLDRSACRSVEDVGMQLADAKPILGRCGRGRDTDLRILSDGEDGLRGVVGTWFGKKCEHRLDDHRARLQQNRSQNQAFEGDCLNHLSRLL